MESQSLYLQPRGFSFLIVVIIRTPLLGCACACKSTRQQHLETVTWQAAVRLWLSGAGHAEGGAASRDLPAAFTHRLVFPQSAGVFQ